MASGIGFMKVGPLERTSYSSTRSFDLKGLNEISQIFISGGDKGITSIQFQYVENGKYVLSDQYGSYSGSNQFHTIELNHPAEYITGFYGLYAGATDNIQVITFTTNIQKYSPFGVTNENLSRFSNYQTSFSYNFGKSCQFGGFHGTYSSSLISIGCYVKPKTVIPKLIQKVPS